MRTIRKVDESEFVHLGKAALKLDTLLTNQVPTLAGDAKRAALIAGLSYYASLLVERKPKTESQFDPET